MTTTPFTTPRRARRHQLPARHFALLLVVAALVGCDDGPMEPEDELIDAKIFTVPLRIDTFDTSDPAVPGYATVAYMIWASFPVDPLAIRYTAEFERSDFPTLNFSGSWPQGGPIHPDFATGLNDAIAGRFWHGYTGGISGGEWHLRLAGGGCASGVGGPCTVGDPSLESTLAVLHDLRRVSTLTITTHYR